MTRFGRYLLRSPLHAAWVALLFGLLPFVGLPTDWASLVIVGLVTLRLGPKYGLFVLFWSALPGIVLAILHHPAWLINVIMIHGGIVWLLAWLLRRTGSWSYVLEIGTLLAVVIVLVTHGMSQNLHQWWFTQIAQSLQSSGMMEELKLNGHNTQNLIALVASVATGMMVVFMLLMCFINVFLARWWQAALFNPGGLRREIYQIRMSRVMASGLLVCLGGLFTKQPIFTDLLPVTIMPFSLSALSLLHLAAYEKKVKGFMLLIIYVLLVLFVPYVAGLLALFGFADTWLDFRKRYN